MNDIEIRDDKLCVVLRPEPTGAVVQVHDLAHRRSWGPALGEGRTA